MPAVSFNPVNRFFLYGAIVISILLCIPACADIKHLDTAETEPVLSLTDAEKNISNSIVPPDFQDAEVVVLPDKWQHDEDGFYGSVWYRIPYPVDKKITQQQAIYLPHVNMNAEVWLNETRLGSGGSMQAPVSRYWHSPLMFVFSPSDIQQENYFFIRVVAYANEFGLLGSVQVGARDEIDEIYRKTFFSTVTIHIISGAMAGAYALFMALVWWQRRDPVFFWAGLVCAIWSVSSMNLYVTNPPVAELWWEKLMQITMGWIPLLFFFFIIRIDGVTYKKVFDKIILWSACTINILILLTTTSHLFFLSRFWHIYAMFFGLIGVFRIFYSWLHYRRNTQLAMVFAFFLIAMCGLHDLFVQNHLLDNTQIFWLDYSVPIIQLLIGYLMVSRFLMAVKTAEDLNIELEDRVRSAYEKIEADYERILMLETEQASNKERERIYRDMHDDMGGKLLSLIYKAESDEMHSLARSAMNDLRAIVSKKTTDWYQLAERLGYWQKTCRERCREAGFAFSWYQKNFKNDIVISSEFERNMQRVLSEAFTNILKHSCGSSVEVDVRVRMGCLRIIISDDSDVSNVDDWVEGRGVSSMRFRIEQLKGRIFWKRNEQSGTRVSLIVPLKKTGAGETGMRKDEGCR